MGAKCFVLNIWRNATGVKIWTNIFHSAVSGHAFMSSAVRTDKLRADGMYAGRKGQGDVRMVNL